MTYLLLSMTLADISTTIKQITSLSWSEIAAMLGVLTIIGGGYIKLVQRTDEKLQLRVDLLEAELKEKFKDCKDHISDVERKITEEREKDTMNRDRAMEKIELRIEKLSDLIIKLIEKN